MTQANPILHFPASGLIDATQERFAVEGRKSAADHLADFVATLRARQNTSKHVSMARRHVEEIIATCKAEQIADLTGDAVLRAIDGIRQAGDKRVKEAADANGLQSENMQRLLAKHQEFHPLAVGGASHRGGPSGGAQEFQRRYRPPARAARIGTG